MKAVPQLSNLYLMPILSILALACAKQDLDLGRLNEWAKARDVVTLDSLLSDKSSRISPFRILKTNGAYEVGRFGWNVLDLKIPGDPKRYVVFTTAMTSEDIGDLLFEVNDGKLKYLPEEFTNTAYPIRHDMEVKLSPATKTATIEDRLVIGHEKGDFTILRVSPSYKIQSIQSEDGKSVPFTQAGGVVAVQTPSSPTFTYRIRYVGIVNQPGYAGSMDAKEAMLTNDYWWPMIGREPAPYSIKVTAPAGWTVVGQGELTGIDKSFPTEWTTSYRMDLPVSYYSLSAGPYKSGGKLTGFPKIVNYSAELTPQELQDQGDFYQTVLNFYDKTFTPYPFKSYGEIASQRYGGGALEAYSYCTAGGMMEEDAHEPAHTWFGGILSNTYLHSFWNESFAVYCEGLYRRNVDLGNKDERNLAFSRHPRISPGYDEVPVGYAGVLAGGNASEMGYGKGAHVLEMLEMILGKDMMVKCMQQWLLTHPKGKSAEWEHFTAVVDKVSGRDLKGFWTDWLYTAGSTEFELADLSYAGGNLSGKVQFKSKLTHFPLEILAESEGHKRDFKTFYCSPDSNGEFRFSWAPPFKPTLVSADPWYRVIRKRGEGDVGNAIPILGSKMTRYQDRREPSYLNTVNYSAKTTKSLGADLDGVFLVGHPDHIPAMLPLCAKAGFKVVGNKLTYKGTTIDLRRGGAIATVELGGGKRCLIGLGTARYAPNTGNAKVALFDVFGRFLRGESDPKTTGVLTYRM